MWRMAHMVVDERGRSGEVRPRAPWGRAGPASARTNVVEIQDDPRPLRRAHLSSPNMHICLSARAIHEAVPKTRRRTGRGEAGPSLYSSRGGGGPPRATLIIIAQAPGAMQETFVTISDHTPPYVPLTSPRHRLTHLRGSLNSRELRGRRFM